MNHNTAIISINIYAAALMVKSPHEAFSTVALMVMGVVWVALAFTARD